MTESYGLSTLKVGIAGHYRVVIFLCLFENYVNEFLERKVNFFNFIKQIKPQIKRNLVVAAARGVEALARAAEPFCKLALNKGMYILCAHVNFKLSAFKVGGNTLKRGNNFFAFAFFNYILLSEHCCMGY